MKNTNIIISIILISMLSIPSLATTFPDNMEYQAQDGTNCEIIAKYYAQKYHMDIYIIVPLKENGALDLGNYNGHIINSKTIDSHQYWFEFNGVSGTHIFTSKHDVIVWYHNMTGKNADVFDTQHTPFQMIWHYD